jgi:hypothetical protein
MAHYLHIVPVGIEKEPCEIVFVIVRTRPRRAVVLSSDGESCLVARTDRRAIRGGEGYVKWVDAARDVFQSEKCVVSRTQACSGVAEVSNELVPERREYREVEGRTSAHVVNREIEMVNHLRRSPLQFGRRILFAKAARLAA